MRRRTYYLCLLPVTLALLALLPIYPVQRMDHGGFHGFSTPDRFTGAFLPATEVYGGAFDWNTETTGCALDGGTRTHFQASPAVLVVHVGAALDLWLLLVFVLSRTNSKATRLMIVSAVSGTLTGSALLWLESYSLVFLQCMTDLGLYRVFAGGLALMSVAAGAGLLLFRDRLAHVLGTRPVVPPYPIRVAKR